MTSTSDPKRDFLRHTLATLAYRGGNALRDAPPGLAETGSGESGRTVSQILAHMGDVLDWGLSIAKGQQIWAKADPLPWEKETGRFFAALRRFDDYLASAEPLHAPAEKLFQGPLADVLTHIGQIAMLRRTAGGPVKSENYFVADIVAGRVGLEQTPPRR